MLLDGLILLIKSKEVFSFSSVLISKKLNKGVKLSASSGMLEFFRQPVKLLGVVVVMAALAACSGSPSSTNSGTGTGTGTGGGTGSSTTKTAASLALLVSSPQLNSDGKSEVTLTVLAKNEGNNGVPDMPVVVSSTSGTLVMAANVTDASGKVTGKLSTLGDPSNREITLVATSGAVSATNTVTVNGTSLHVSGTNSLVFGNSTELQISVKDSAGTGIDKATVQLASALGNTLSAQSLITDSAGNAKVVLRGTAAGNDTITLTSLGASKTFAVSVSSSNFQFVSPVTGSSANIGSVVPVSIKWEEAGVPQAGKTVSFSSTRGVIAASAVTGADGVATTNISSAEAGNAIVTASSATGTPFNTVGLSFVATSASRVDVQSDKSIVAVFKENSLDSLTIIRAMVRDAGNNLVKNAKVNFQLVSDPSGGSLDNSVATTDESGVATVQYRAGAISSGQNAVVISAKVTDVAGVPVIGSVSSEMRLTVGGQSLFIRLGTDNRVVSQTPVYVKRWTAIVTDAAGNPVPNTSVQFRLRPAATNAYRKGYWYFFVPKDMNNDGVIEAVPPEGVTLSSWDQEYSDICQNEDVNFNGILDSGEDFNGNGLLTPGNVASVNKSATTDASGVAYADVTYAKDYATWAKVTLQAAIQVAGTEFTQAVDFVLPNLAEDYERITVSPPGQVSPFGIAPGCNNTN